MDIDDTFRIDSDVLGALLEAYVRFSVHDDKDEKVKSYRIKEMNRQAEHICKLRQEDVVGQDALDVFTIGKECWQRLQNVLERPEQTGPVDFYLKELDRRFLINPVRVSTEEVVIFFVEITYRQKAKDAFRIHEILFHHAQDIILYIDMEGNVLNANRKACKSYGYTEEELKTLTIQDLRDFSVTEVFDEQMHAADSGGTVFESLHRRSDGSTFPVEVSANSTDTMVGKIRIHIIRDITERREQEAKIAWLARYDGLTEILNRNSLIEELEKELYRAKREKSMFAVLLFDIDKFKLINDNFGHAAGDFVLKHVASQVKSILRQSDCLGRLGGDEFVILQIGIKEPEDVFFLVQRLKDELAKPVLYDGNKIVFSLSLGISICPDDATDVQKLLHFADQAMYETKRRGGNGYTMYHSLPTM